MKQRLEFTYVTVLAANFANHNYSILTRLQQQTTRFGISGHILLAIQRTLDALCRVIYAKEKQTTLDKQPTYLIE